MAYIDTKYLGKCETCRHCIGDIKCSTYCDHGEEYFPNLSKIPEADVVEVVRCKDCKQWRRNIGFADSPNGHCFYLDVDVNGFDYCSYGEKK